MSDPSWGGVFRRLLAGVSAFSILANAVSIPAAFADGTFAIQRAEEISLYQSTLYLTGSADYGGMSEYDVEYLSGSDWGLIGTGSSVFTDADGNKLIGADTSSIPLETTGATFRVSLYDGTGGIIDRTPEFSYVFPSEPLAGAFKVYSPGSGMGTAMTGSVDFGSNTGAVAVRFKQTAGFRSATLDCDQVSNLFIDGQPAQTVAVSDISTAYGAMSAYGPNGVYSGSSIVVYHASKSWGSVFYLDPSLGHIGTPSSTHELTMICGGGNAAMMSWVVPNAPTVSILSHASGATIVGSGPEYALTLTGTAIEASGSVVSVFATGSAPMMRNFSAACSGTGSWSCDFNSLGMNYLSEGSNEITVYAIDANGNTGSTTITVIAGPDTQAPAVSVLSHSSGSHFVGTALTLTGTAADPSGVASIHITTNGFIDLRVAEGTGSWSYEINPADLRIGENSFSVWAEDALGNGSAMPGMPNPSALSFTLYRDPEPSYLTGEILSATGASSIVGTHNPYTVSFVLSGATIAEGMSLTADLENEARHATGTVSLSAGQSSGSVSFPISDAFASYTGSQLRLHLMLFGSGMSYDAGSPYDDLLEYDIAFTQDDAPTISAPWYVIDERPDGRHKHFSFPGDAISLTYTGTQAGDLLSLYGSGISEDTGEEFDNHATDGLFALIGTGTAAGSSGTLTVSVPADFPVGNYVLVLSRTVDGVEGERFSVPKAYDYANDGGMSVILPPSATLASHASGSHFTGSTLTLTGTASSMMAPVASVSVNGQPATGTGEWSYTLTGLSVGANAVSVEVSDLAGFTGSTAFTLYRDADLAAVPTVSVLSHSSGSHFTGSTLTLTGTASDDVGVVSVEVDGFAASGTGEWSYTRLGLLPGANLIEITAQDADGNVGTSHITLYRDADTTPDAFTFSGVANAELSSVITSAPITISGLEDATPSLASASGGEYSINGTTTFTSDGVFPVYNGDTVYVRLTTSANYSTAASATLTVGGVSATFTATTKAAPDTTAPTVSVLSHASGSHFTGSTLTLTGTASDNFGVASVSVNGHPAAGTGSWSYALTGASFGANAVSVVAADAAGNTGSTAITLFRDADTTPDAFAFSGVSNAERSASVVSSPIVVSGTDTGSVVSVSGGEYRVGTGGTFGSATGTVNPGDTVYVRLTTSANYSTAASATLTVGGVSATFTATTKAAPASSGGGSSSGGGGGGYSSSSSSSAASASVPASQPAAAAVGVPSADLKASLTQTAKTVQVAKEKVGNTDYKVAVSRNPAVAKASVAVLRAISHANLPAAQEAKAVSLHNIFVVAVENWRQTGDAKAKDYAVLAAKALLAALKK